MINIENSCSEGTLYIVATPIGNLEDITLRAIRILKEVDMIAAEDTRHTRKLLQHLGINKKLISYYKEKEKERSATIIGHLQAGENVALVSDAGTPGISDPGAILVHEARNNDIKIVPIPGASALTTALSCAGENHSRFLFIGFPPSKKSHRKKLLISLKNESHSLIFYESPRRISGFLEDAIAIFGDRDAVWARELTKTYEEFLSKKLSELCRIAKDRNNKGENVVIISPGVQEKLLSEDLEELICWYRDNSDLTLKDTSKLLSSDLGISRSEVYKTALSLWGEG